MAVPNDIFNQLMELLEEIEHEWVEAGYSAYAETIRKGISKIVDPLNDQLIDWRLDPDPEPMNRPPEVVEQEPPGRKWTVTVVSLGESKVHTFDTQLEARRFADGIYDKTLRRPEDRR